jgi:hypothetical protein
MAHASHAPLPAGATASAADWSALLPVLTAAIVYVVVLIVGSKLLNDPDSFWHLTVGQWIVENGSVPRADTYSFTKPGAPWVAKEWLSQVLFAISWEFAGWTGMVLLAAGAFALTFGVFVRALLRYLTPMPVVAFASITFLLAAPHALARPHMLALPVMVAFLAGLVRAVDEDRLPSLWLLPLMVLWANLHGGFTFGLVLTAACALDAVVRAPPVHRNRTFVGWFAFGLLVLAAACITPYGPESILVTARILGMGSSLSIISEWAPANFGQISGLEVVMLLGIGIVLYRGFVLPPVRIIIVLGLLHMALSAERNAELFAFLVPLFVAAPLARQFPALSTGRTVEIEPPRYGVLAAAISVLAVLTATMTWISSYGPDPRVSPARAVEALVAADAGPVLNEYAFGGYLIHAGVPPFIDGRTELYGADFLSQYHEAVRLTDLPGFLAILHRYGIGATLLAPGTPAVAYLDTLPDWKRLHSDPVAVVHVRTEP